MKKNEIVEITTATNIILNDKELEVLVRQLVKRTHEKGSSMTQLNKAINTIWKEEFSVEKEEDKLTADEESFMKKTEIFLKHYQMDLIDLYNESQKNKRCIIRESDLLRKSNFFERYYQIISSIYAVFEREEKINQSKIVKFAKEHFGFRYNLIGDECDLLHRFVYNHLCFNTNDELPGYSRLYVGYNNSISKVKEFVEFKAQYKCSRAQINETVIAMVWIIQKYF